MSLRSQIGVTATLAALVAAGWFWLAGWNGATKSEAKREPRSAAAVVLVEALALAEDRVVVQAVGTGEALQSAAIYPSVAGEVVEVLFTAGQRVDKGAPLVRLDDKHARLAVRLAQVARKEAQREVARLEKLAPSGAVPVVRLETARAALESAGLRLAQANADLEDRTVFAPFDGVVGLTKVNKGDRVTEDTPITTLDDRSFVLVEFAVPEAYAGGVHVGDTISVRPWTEPDREVRGTVSEMDSRIDPATRTLRVKARIPNPDDRIRPGTSFEVRLAFTGGSYPSIREVAVLWSRDGAYVWRVVGGRAEKVFVRVVRRDGGQVLVDGPLEAGDLIVVEGLQGLRVGQAVEPLPFGRDQAGTPGPAAMDRPS